MPIAAASLGGRACRLTLSLEVLDLGILVEGICRVACLPEDGCIALVLQTQGEVLATRRDDPAVGEHVHLIGRDVVEEPLVVGDEEDAEVRVELGVDAFGDDTQGVDVETGVGLVQDGELGLGSPSGASRGASSRRPRSLR
jgi:hypothetical protein